VELELASTLPAPAGLAFSERSLSVCGAFGWHSWTANTKAAKTTVPKSPVASQTVSRLNLLIVAGAIVYWCLRFLTAYAGFSTQVTPLKRNRGVVRGPLATPLERSSTRYDRVILVCPSVLPQKSVLGFQELKWRRA
jgi:hypothetical protein